MGAGVHMDITSKKYLVSNMSNKIVKDLHELIGSRAFEAEIIGINESEILFKYDISFSDLIDENYILSSKRKYIAFDFPI